MSIYLREVNDDTGDLVELSWYCSHACWADSFDTEPASDTFESGGRYPGGAESDTPDYCDTCHAAIGNALTPYGVEYVRENAEHWNAETVAELARTYPGILDTDVVSA